MAATARASLITALQLAQKYWQAQEGRKNGSEDTLGEAEEVSTFTYYPVDTSVLNNIVGSVQVRLMHASHSGSMQLRTIHSLIVIREGLILRLTIFIRQWGWIFRQTPVDVIS